MPSECKFELNNINAIYFGGEIIAGTITLKTTSEKNVRDISIIFLGEGKVQWKRHNTRGNIGQSTARFKGHEIYINNCTQVHGDAVLPAGIHTYTFNITLPLDCPTSCEGKYGYVRYVISLRINRYYRLNNVFKRPVTIIKHFDLNLYPDYKLPLESECLKSICCWPCSKGKILLGLKIPFSAYVCGQIVRYTLNIANQSMDDIEGYLIRFINRTTFTATHPRRKQRHFDTVLVSQFFENKFLRLTNRIIEGEFLIPATPPSTEKSNLICVEYSFKVSLKLSRCRFNPDVKVPIVIGIMPISESLHTCAEQLQILPTEPQLPSMHSDINMPTNYNGIDPPTFEEATHNTSPFYDSDSDEADCVVDFSPLYPMYNFSRNGN